MKRRASSVILGADLPEGQLAYAGDKEGGIVGGLFLGREKDDLPEGRFAYVGEGPVNKGGLAGGPVRFQRRRTCRRTSLWGQRRRTYAGTKKENPLEGQFACPGHKEGRSAVPEGQLLNPGNKEGVRVTEDVCLSWIQRKTCLRVHLS